MSAPGPDILRFGTFEVDVRSGELRKHGKKIKLQGQPFQVLAVLLQRPGDVVTREELRSLLWQQDTFVDFDDGLNTAISKIREALGDSADSPHFIETLPRRGYRFIVAAPTPSDREVVHSRFSFGKNLKLFLAGGLCFAVLVVVALTIGYWRKSRAGAAAARIQSIAVLPLENLSGDPSQEYFAEGMTDALITKLAGIRRLRVISRTSTTLYKGSRKTLPDIAHELNVDGVVEGTVARSNDQVRITAQLIYAQTDSHLWSASFTGSMRDVLELEDKVARDITNQISDNLGDAELNSLRKRRATNPEAYDAYLKGVYSLNTQTPDGVRAAIRYFQDAIEKDESFALAYARLSSCYSLLSILSEVPSAETYKPAKLAAQKAIALDDNLDQAHVGAAWVAGNYEWDWHTAEEEYGRAIHLNPNSAAAHMGYSILLQILGRSRESLDEERAAKVVDPLSVESFGTSMANSYFRRQYDKSLAQTREALALYPGVPMFHVHLSNLYAVQGLDKESAQEILSAEELGGATPERVAALKKANLLGGLKGLRRKRIELNKEASEKGVPNAYDIAIDNAADGNMDESLIWLERAFRVRDGKVVLIGVEPIFDGLRSNQRFIHLLHQLGLEPSQS